MQQDSMNSSTSDPVTPDQIITQESPIKSLQCSHCTLVFKSKVYLFEHLNQAHGLDVDSALRDAGLKSTGTSRASTENHSSSSMVFGCHYCDFKACGREALNEHEKRCNKKSEDQKVIGNLNRSGNSEINITVNSTTQHSEAVSVMSTSKSKCSLNSKDLKLYKRPLQTITKYFAASSASNGKSPVKLADSPAPLDSAKGTLILQDSASNSSLNSSGVFKVTAMHSMIDNTISNHFMLNDHFLNSDRRPPKSKEQSTEPAPDNIGKRTNSGSSKCPPAKKAKSDKEETKLPEEANASQQQSPSNKEFSFEVSEEEGERRLFLVNGDTESSKLYFCKHCDYSGAIGSLSTHYQTNHPYVRYNAAYIRDPNDDSATFRCLQCPAEFLSVAYLKRHYAENHPEAPNVFTMQSCELNLVFRCFVCSFTTNTLKALKRHYKENHPTHEVDDSLMYCKYSVTGCQEGSSQSKTCENTSSSERQGRISPKSASTPCKEVENAPSPQHPTTTGADVALYHCNNCTFSHKSTVVMHVHYQKSHPGEEVTIDKIKQSVHVTSPTTTQMAPDKSLNAVQISENSTPRMNISDFFKKTKDKAELSEHKDKPEDSKTHSESPKTGKVISLKNKSKGKKMPTDCNRETSAGIGRFSGSSTDKLFYCQSCSYSSTNIKSVVGHHNAKHARNALTSIEEILVYSAGLQKKKLQSGAEASESAKTAESKTSKQDEVYREKNLQDEAAGALVTNDFNGYACAEKLFYCQKCNYGNISAKGVANHQNQVHRTLPYDKECILKHTAVIRDEIEKSKTQAKEFSFSTRLPLPLMNEGDENMFFCHFCNYRQSTLDYVMKHYFKKHRGFVVTHKQIQLYTTLVREKTQKSHLKSTANQEVNPPSHAERRNEKKITPDKSSVSAPPSMAALQSQRTLQCYRCSFNTQYVDALKRHIWKTHRANRSVTEVLRVCFKQGNLQAGYHCDLCVFSHEKAAAVYEHYQEQHEARKPSLQFVTTRLYVGPKACPNKRKKPQIKHGDGICDDDGTDGSIPSQKSEQNESQTYSCRACSFKSSSMSGITLHYRAVHPWSMKDDGSVPNVIIRKKPSANRQVEDMPGLFESYQEPLEFDMLPASSPKATASSTVLRCPYCPLKFNSKHGLRVHCGMKHHEAVAENSDKKQEEVQNHMHVFKCLHCTYVNTNYQGVLTHCQMKHPALVARADSHHVDEAYSRNWGDSLKIKGPGSSLRLSGYMCETCPQICATLEKLNRHFKKGHIETVTNTVPNKLKPPLKPLVVGKMKQFKTLSNRGSVSQASFFNMKKYAVIKCQHCSYNCSTQIALSRHLRLHHRYASVSKVKDCVYRCILCSKAYFKKKRLGSHYMKKHGRDSFLKYFAPVYKHTHEKPVPTSPDRPLPQPENTCEAPKSNTTSEENKRLIVYKCPSCPYVNASYHGTLTHCQMRHPTVRARADELQTEEVLVTNMVNCPIGQSSNERGYVCKLCPLIYASLKKLKKHCERDHDQAAAFEHSADIGTKIQSDHGSALKALESKTSAVSTTEISFNHQTCQLNTPSVQNKQKVYKCHICNYKGFFRRYLQSHYKKNHKLDALTTNKLLEKYNICRKTSKLPSKLPEVESEENSPLKCKKCPELVFDSSQLLVAHYDTFHSSDCMLDFTVLSQGTKKGSTGLYRCVHCNKQMNGIRKLWYHLDCHRESAKKKSMPVKTEASLAVTTTSAANSIKVCRQEEPLELETVEELTHLHVTPVKIFTWPTSPLSSPSKPSDVEQPQLESKEDQHPCQQCRRTFRSLKGLRSHERSHAAVAAIRNNLPISVLKHNINKYVLYKSGTLKPFRCSFCSYRTTVMGLWRSHFMRTHQDDLSECDETEDQDEECLQRADKEPFSSSEELNNWPEPEEEQEMSEKTLYLEPPDVQRQLNHYSLMSQADAQSRTNVPEARLPENSLLHCEFCNFNSGHMSSIRRHYLNRHGKKMLRCKDCDFFTCLRKTLEMHMDTVHSTCQSEPTHQKDLRCPFCLYQTKNKNNMIDHIVLHREERVVPIEVRRSKLSRYLQGIVFRCHKCTFTSGSADNLRSHMTRHNDIKPYKCRLCYFDSTRLSDLEAHLSDKHQVVRNHELVGQVSLDQLQVRAGRMPEEDVAEPLSNFEHHKDNSEDVETEEFVTDCDEVPHETQAKDLAENNMREKMTLRTKEPYQKQGKSGKNNEIPAKTSAFDLHYEKAKLNAAVQEEQEQDLQVFLPARPESKDSGITFTQQKEEPTEESLTCGKLAEKAQTHKLHNEELQHKLLGIKAKVEDDLVQNVHLLDEDASTCMTHKEAAQDGTVNTENIENEVLGNVRSGMILLDKKGSITLANNTPENQVNTAAISAKEEHVQANDSRAQESFTVERHLLTLQPNCVEPRISQKESSGVSLTDCKKEQVQNLKNSKEVRDPYGEMPVLENEYLKEEMQPLGCCKEEEQSDHLEQLAEDDENRGRKHEEADLMKEAVNPHVPKDALTVTDGAPEVLCPAATEEKPFTCEFCGRNLMNSSNLERHIMRHGL